MSAVVRAEKALLDVGLEPLVEIARIETILSRRLIGAVAVAGRAAVREIVSTEEPTERAVADVLARAGRAHAATLRREVRPLLHRYVPRVFALSRKVFAAKAAGRFTGAIDYDAARIAVSKTDEIPQATEEDEDDAEKLVALLLLWAREHWLGAVFPRISERLDAEVFVEGATAASASRALATIVREEAGTKPIGDEERVPVGRSAAEIVAIESVTMARAFGALSALAAAGVGHWVWVTAGDERVCRRCSAMDGRKFPVDGTRAFHEKLLGAETLDEQKRVAPWYGENELRGILRTADASDDPAGVLLAHGVTIPLHGHCRCSLDFVPASD